LIHLQAVQDSRNASVRKAIEPLAIATFDAWRKTSGDLIMPAPDDAPTHAVPTISVVLPACGRMACSTAAWTR